jgi:hypothetical protein
MITLRAEGLEPGSDVSILAGLTREELRPSGKDQANRDGQFETTVRIPEWAERGKPFYFVVEQNGRQIGLASVNEVAPATAGGAAVD